MTEYKKAHTDRVRGMFSDAPRGWSPDAMATIDFIEGTRAVPELELVEKSVTPRRVPRFYEEHIRAGDHYEKLRLIVEPSVRELEADGSLDTSGEAENTVVPGLQHKYPQTGLMLVTEQCAAFCRYCFRKRFVGKSQDEVAVDYDRIADYISCNPEMNNVLLSGGDPFMLKTRTLHEILDRLLPIPHLSSIRMGTKTITFNPLRLREPGFKGVFERIVDSGKTAVVVTHFDHFAEISDEARRHIREYREIGVQFLNQGVLLKGVNDDVETLTRTFADLHAIGLRPYYLFQTRPIVGASRFQVSLREGAALVRTVQGNLSGIQKTFRYVMSHVTGKIEILGFDTDTDRLVMRYHQAKDTANAGLVFTRDCPTDAKWLDDLSSD